MREVVWGRGDDEEDFGDLDEEKRYAAVATLEPLQIDGRPQQVPSLTEGEHVFLVVHDRGIHLRMFACLDLKEMQTIYDTLTPLDESQWYRGSWDELQNFFRTA